MPKPKSKPNEAPDGFTFSADDPYPELQRGLTEFLSEARRLRAEEVKPQALASGRRLLELAKEDQVRVLLAALNRMMWLCVRGAPLRAKLQDQDTHTDANVKSLQAHEHLQGALSGLIGTLAGRKLPLTEEQLRQLLDVVVTGTRKQGDKPGVFDLMQTPIPGVLPLLVGELETQFNSRGVSAAFRPGLEQLAGTLKEWEFWAGYKKTLARVQSLLKSGARGSVERELPDAGEAWADALREDIAAMQSTQRKSWLALLANVPGATLARPTAKWKASAQPILSVVGPEEFARQTERWFGIIGVKAQEKLVTRNGLILRALIWYAGMVGGETICRALANAVEGGCRKLPQGGLFASSIAKACIAALEGMDGLPALAQLSRLKHRVKSPWGQEEIQKALSSAVARGSVSLAELEEISCPTFDLDGESTTRRPVGAFTAELTVTGTHEVTIVWRDAKQQSLAREPRELKSHAAEVKAVKRLRQDMEKLLLAQRDRIERLLLAPRSWPLPVWRERYLDHPLLSHQARRLIWQFTDGKRSEEGIWSGGGLVNVRGQSLDWLKPGTQVQLWHPLGVPADCVMAWRRWLEENQISQPFKQAHREIYLLTDAEIKTRTYSHRFAAHILRQHQFKALCDARGWKYEFLGTWDSGGHAGARLDLPPWKLAAHFWLEPAGDQFSPAGVARYASTDQVRFSDEQTAARELTEVAAVVFSEVMRDVDLFVSVCSIGSDPEWGDNRTAPPTQRAYWQDFAFGELSPSAQTRHEVLTRLLPKLAISSRCSLEKKFLVVKGSLRTYKIHLGSGNILMSPNDQYLCIVPDRATETTGPGNVFLPFEGDRILSVILSKAFLLAEDAKIKDSSIVSQIKGS